MDQRVSIVGFKPDNIRKSNRMGFNGRPKEITCVKISPLRSVVGKDQKV
jgi:hypothetical protein